VAVGATMVGKVHTVFDPKRAQLRPCSASGQGRGTGPLRVRLDPGAGRHARPRSPPGPGTRHASAPRLPHRHGPARLQGRRGLLTPRRPPVQRGSHTRPPGAAAAELPQVGAQDHDHGRCEASADLHKMMVRGHGRALSPHRVTRARG
jgi:hypothetical protein